MSKEIRDAGGTVLIVDDEPPVRLLYERFLAGEGYRTLVASSGEEALETLGREEVDLVLLDLVMPGMSGIETLREIRKLKPAGMLPVVIVSGHGDRASRLEGFEAGCDEFLSKPTDRTELVLRVKNLTAVKVYHDFLHGENESLSTAVRERTLSLRNAMKALRTSQEEARAIGEEALLILSRPLEFRADLASEHQKRVGLYGAAIGTRLGWSSRECEVFTLAAAMHDVGMVIVPAVVLYRKEKLVEDERTIVRQHTDLGQAILRVSLNPVFQLGALIAAGHHERWDGSGYPRGLAGTDAPLEARVTAVADVFDALTSDRPHRGACPPKEALDYLKSQIGREFEPALVRHFESAFEQILLIREQHPDRHESV